MGACMKKSSVKESPQEWQTNPLKFIEKLDDVCLLCHEEFDRDFCFAKCCGYFYHTDCMEKYHKYCKAQNKKILCPTCRIPMKSVV
jgi:hypothetical protein